MDQRDQPGKPSNVAAGKPIFLTAKEKQDAATAITYSPWKSSRERDNLQNAPPQYFITTSGGAEDQGISQERSEALASFYNDIVETVRSTSHAAVLKATKKIVNSTSKEEAARHGRVMSVAIEAAACNAARRGVSEALQEHPTCEICKRYYYESRGPKHPQYDPQDRLFKCINWPCKKWYHVGCLNIKYEMKDTYMCMGRFAPCVKIVRRQTNPAVITETPIRRDQFASTTLTTPRLLPLMATATTMAPRPFRAGSTLPPYTTQVAATTMSTQPCAELLAPHQNEQTIPTKRPYHQYAASLGVPARIPATKGFKKCRGDGKCMKFTHVGNLPTKCEWGECKLKPLCRSCKDNSGAVEGEKWFCTRECRENYLAKFGETEERTGEEGKEGEDA
ncbi:hypothetical protein E2P81_ATG10728 [Venturia nashicola]|nr:hypothetical protein E2P81_ATG10728 [Venturia nashicola]